MVLILNGIDVASIIIMMASDQNSWQYHEKPGLGGSSNGWTTAHPTLLGERFVFCGNQSLG